MSEQKRDCQACKWSGFDIADGPYCVHPKVVEKHSFGLSLSSVRMREFCPAPEHPLWTDKAAKSPQGSRSAAEGPSPSSPLSPPSHGNELREVFKAVLREYDAKNMDEDEAVEELMGALRDFSKPSPSQGAEARPNNPYPDADMILCLEQRVETLEAERDTADRIIGEQAKEAVRRGWRVVELEFALKKAAEWAEAQPSRSAKVAAKIMREALVGPAPSERAPEAPAPYPDGDWSEEKVDGWNAAWAAIRKMAPSAAGPLRDAKRVEEPGRTVAAVLAWQADGRIHPLTCKDSNHGALLPYVELDGGVHLMCRTCTYRQAWIPEVVLEKYANEAAQPPLPAGEGSSPETSEGKEVDRGR